jgi:hypothetical protein
MNLKCTLLVLEASGSQPSGDHSAYGIAVFMQCALFNKILNYHKIEK